MILRKTFSQKIAFFFENVCYVLLIPAIISILLTFAYAGILVFIPLAVTCVGVHLLFCYRKHARGTFDKKKLYRLWFGTLIFNGIPLAPVFYQFIFNPDAFKRFVPADGLNFGTLFTFLLILWWITAFSLSITLLLDEFRRNARIK